MRTIPCHVGLRLSFIGHILRTMPQIHDTGHVAGVNAAI